MPQVAHVAPLIPSLTSLTSARPGEASKEVRATEAPKKRTFLNMRSRSNPVPAPGTVTPIHADGIGSGDEMDVVGKPTDVMGHRTVGNVTPFHSAGPALDPVAPRVRSPGFPTATVKIPSGNPDPHPGEIPGRRAEHAGVWSSGGTTQWAGLVMAPKRGAEAGYAPADQRGGYRTSPSAEGATGEPAATNRREPTRGVRSWRFAARARPAGKRR